MSVQDLSLQRLSQHLLASSADTSFWSSTSWLAMLGNAAVLVVDGAVQVQLRSHAASCIWVPGHEWPGMELVL